MDPSFNPEQITESTLISDPEERHPDVRDGFLGYVFISPPSS